MKSLKKPFLYALCGGAGATFDFILYAVLVSTGLIHHAANVAGYASGTLLSFALNRAITFRIMDAPVRRLTTFTIVALIGYLCSASVLLLMVDILNFDPLQAKAVSIFVVYAVQYTLNSRVTFRPRS